MAAQVYPAAYWHSMMELPDESELEIIDAGWKGRGLWLPSGDRTPWLKEGGQGTKPLVVHFQLRPDPLAL